MPFGRAVNTEIILKDTPKSFRIQWYFEKYGGFKQIEFDFARIFGPIKHPHPDPISVQWIKRYL